MKFAMMVVAVILGCVFASQLHAGLFGGGGTKIRFGMMGTTVRAGCGASVCASPCGVKVMYNGGGGGCGQMQQYGGGGCYSGSCGQMQGGCAQGNCGAQVQHYNSAPFGVNCTPNYGTHTQNCTESFVPYTDPAVYGAQMRYRGF